MIASRTLPFEMTSQPTETTCGPACLHAVYRYYNETITLDTILSEIERLPDGGSLAVFLALHAMRRGYQSTIYTCNLHMFDPTWDYNDPELLKRKLLAQRRAKPDPKLHQATDAYLEYLDRGGKLKMEDLTPELLAAPLEQGTPMITGLSATWLYRTVRDKVDDQTMKDDDIGGEPLGHFVVIHGIDPQHHLAYVADPYPPWQKTHASARGISIERLIGAILLGVITYDAKLLLLTPPQSAPKG